VSKGKTRALAARGRRLLRQIFIGLLAQADVLCRAYNRKESSAPASKGGSSCQCQDREPSPAPAFGGLARRWPCLPALAALYVGELLSDEDQEAYEIHFMRCTECVAEVELWRGIASELRRVDDVEFVTAADVLTDLDKRMGDMRLRVTLPDSMRKAG
jgi:hypothetical protein